MSLIRIARLAALLAVALALVLSGIVSGAPGTTGQRQSRVNAGTGINADKLDGLDSYAFLRSKTYGNTRHIEMDPQSGNRWFLNCDAYDRALNGGYALSLPEGEGIPSPDFLVWQNHSNGGIGWTVEIENKSDGVLVVDLVVQCADRLPYHQP